MRSKVSKAFGKRLSRSLSRNQTKRFGRWLKVVDDKLNLAYLAERLNYEQDVIQDYIGKVQNLPAGQENLISIITPIYGIKLKYIRQFFQSIQRQSYQHWELCLCLDGEKDRAVQRYFEKLNAQTPDQVKLIRHERNQGICAATQSALGLSTGQIITFIDSDDTLHKDALAALTKAFISDDKVDLVYTNNDILTPWGYRIDPLYKPAWSPELLLCCNYIVHLVALRRTLLDRCENLWSAQFNGTQDWDLLLRAGKLARRVHHIPIVLYHWRAHDSSMAGTALAKPWAWEAATELMEHYIAELDERLHWDWNSGEGPAPLRFMNNILPHLYVIEVETSSSMHSSKHVPEIDYSGEITRIKATLEGDTLVQQAATLDKITASLPDKNAMLLFCCAEAAGTQLKGSIDTLAAYGVMEGVACVWPFYDEWRGIYTVCENFLSPKLRQSSFFTAWSGNVLTGPLHGLVIEFSVLQSLKGFSGACSESLDPALSVQALGALLGLRALDQDMRNVSARSVFSNWRAPVLELAHKTPEFDPYL